MKLICYCDCNKEKREVEWDGCSSYQLSQLLKCPSCGKRMEIEQENHDEGPKWSTIMTPTIDSMTPAQRKKLLKERSNRDFHKNIEVRKREMDKNIIPR